MKNHFVHCIFIGSINKYYVPILGQISTLRLLCEWDRTELMGAEGASAPGCKILKAQIIEGIYYFEKKLYDTIKSYIINSDYDSTLGVKYYSIIIVDSTPNVYKRRQ